MTPLNSAKERRESTFSFFKNWPAYHIKGANDPVESDGKIFSTSNRAKELMTVKHYGYNMKIKSLGLFWQHVTKQQYGRNHKLNVTHVYLQFEEKNGTKVSFSIPDAEDFSNIDLKTENNEHISLLYEIVKEKNKTVIDFSAFDIASLKKRVVTVAYPISIDGIIEGVIFWEYDLISTFNNVMIPESFYASKAPFIQFRKPQHRSSKFSSMPEEQLIESKGTDKDGNKLKYPAVNSIFNVYRLETKDGQVAPVKMIDDAS